jgi:hypothetical protein
MATGRDVAKFVTQMTNKNFVALYDEAEQNDNQLKTEAQNKFKNLVDRMCVIDKRQLKQVID